MANQFFGVYREGGAQRVSLVNLTPAVVTGTASTAGTDIELRVATVDGLGNVITKKDVSTALSKLRAWILNAEDSPFPPL